MGLKKDAKTIFYEALKAASPSHIIPKNVALKENKLYVHNDHYNLNEYKRVFIFGSGKASVAMAQALFDILEDKVHGGLIITRDGGGNMGPLELVLGAHPIPNHDSLDAGEAMVSAFKNLQKSDFYIYVLSGGSSAMMENLDKNITLRDLQKTSDILLSNPLSIEQINKVRKKISLVKGGGLAESTKAKGIVLVLSDVIGNDLSIIGSGPLYPDKNPYKKDDISKSIFKKFPKSVQKAIEKRSKSKEKKYPKHYIIASNTLALQEAKKKAEELGYKTSIVTDRLAGLAVDAAQNITKDILNLKNKTSTCKLYGGETTVDVEGSGLGGRNQHMALCALSLLKDTPNIAFLSAGTDGKDGNSKATGACINAKSYKQAKKCRLDIKKYLKNFDSYTFFEKTGDTIRTGSTGTNVMDITLVLKKIKTKDVKQ